MKHRQEQMEQVSLSWRESGLNKKAFCLQENIAYGTFHYWCKRLSIPLPAHLRREEIIIEPQEDVTGLTRLEDEVTEVLEVRRRSST